MKMYRVYVAEDEPAALNHILTLIELKCPRFEVAGTADNGRTAFEQLEKLRPDVLITDVRMPLMDGIELVCKVKEKYPSVADRRHNRKTRKFRFRYEEDIRRTSRPAV